MIFFSSFTTPITIANSPKLESLLKQLEQLENENTAQVRRSKRMKTLKKVALVAVPVVATGAAIYTLSKLNFSMPKLAVPKINAESESKLERIEELQEPKEKLEIKQEVQQELPTLSLQRLSHQNLHRLRSTPGRGILSSYQAMLAAQTTQPTRPKIDRDDFLKQFESSDVAPTAEITSAGSMTEIALNGACLVAALVATQLMTAAQTAAPAIVPAAGQMMLPIATNSFKAASPILGRCLLQALPVGLSIIRALPK